MKTNKDLIHHLQNFVSEERFQRIVDVASNRTKHITLVLENLFKAHNASAILRTAECYGLQDIYVSESNNKFEVHDDIVIGASKWLDLHKYTGENNIRQCYADLKKRGYQIAATTLSEKSIPIQQLDPTKKFALAFGTELTGISAEALELADVHVQIPMYGFTQSFNVSVSAGICLHHLSDQLRKKEVNYLLKEDEKDELIIEWLKKTIKQSEGIIEKYLNS